MEKFWNILKRLQLPISIIMLITMGLIGNFWAMAAWIIIALSETIPVLKYIEKKLEQKVLELEAKNKE